MAQSTDTSEAMRNPAGRLLLILDTVMAYRPQDHRGRDAWPIIFGLASSARPSHIFDKLALMLRLPGEIERRVTRLELDPKRFVDCWRKPFDEAVPSLSLSARLAEFSTKVDGACLNSLWFVSHEFAPHHVEPSCSPEQLQETEADVKALIDLVLESYELGDELRDYFLTHLHLIQRAIDEFRFLGITPIREAVNSAFGSIVTSRQAEPSFLAEVGKKYWEFFRRIATVYSVAESGSKLLEHAHTVIDFCLPGK